MRALVEEGMPENAAKMGEEMRDELSKIKFSIISDQRGRGLFRISKVNHDSYVKGSDLAYIILYLGLLTKANHDYSLRLATPLVINEDYIRESSSILREGVLVLENLNKERSTSGAAKKHYWIY